MRQKVKFYIQEQETILKKDQRQVENIRLEHM